MYSPAEISKIESFIKQHEYQECRNYIEAMFIKNNVKWSDVWNNPTDHKELIMRILPITKTSDYFHIGIALSDIMFMQGWNSNVPMYDFRSKISILNRISINELNGFNPEVNPKEWFPCNPSICKRYDGNGYYILQRLVNFSSNRATNYKSHSTDGLFKTRNILLTTDSNFKVISKIEVIDESNRTIYPKHVQGLEDMQIFHINEKKKKHKRLGFFCTLVDCQPSGQPQIGFGILTISTGKVSKVTTMTIDSSKCEKNWLPYYDNGLRILYSGCNMQRLRYKLEDLTLKPEPSSGFDNRLRDTRGSGGPIPFDEGFLILFHECIFMDGLRTYIHRFVHVDKGFSVIGISRFFVFEGEDIEFARSMIWDNEHDNILIGVGISDAKAFVYVVDPNVVRDMIMFT